MTGSLRCCRRCKRPSAPLRLCALPIIVAGLPIERVAAEGGTVEATVHGYNLCAAALQRILQFQEYRGLSAPNPNQNGKTPEFPAKMQVVSNVQTGSK